MQLQRGTDVKSVQEKVQEMSEWAEQRQIVKQLEEKVTLPASKGISVLFA